MGRQINFYMDSETQDRFIDYIIESEFVLLNPWASVIDVRESNVYNIMLYKESYGDLVRCQYGRKQIDQLTSPVIEFSKATINRERKVMHRGRIWIATQYFADDGTIIRKDAGLIKDYERLVRWIKKNVPYQLIPKGGYELKEYANDSLFELYKSGFIYR